MRQSISDMDIFSHPKLAKHLQNFDHMVVAFGKEQAKAIHRRLDQLKAARCLEDIRHAPGKCHELVGNHAGRFSIDLRGPYRMIFCPSGDREEYMDGSTVVWTRVTAIEIILLIKDTHR